MQLRVRSCCCIVCTSLRLVMASLFVKSRSPHHGPPMPLYTGVKQIKIIAKWAARAPLSHKGKPTPQRCKSIPGMPTSARCASDASELLSEACRWCLACLAGSGLCTRIDYSEQSPSVRGNGERVFGKHRRSMHRPSLCQAPSGTDHFTVTS